MRCVERYLLPDLYLLYTAMWRRMPELPSIKQQLESCYRKAHEQICSVLNVNRSRAVCI